jgi:CRISPR-associated protein Csd1
MILQALHHYYQRRQADPDPSRRLPAFGFEHKEIAFVVELAADGRVLGLTDTRSPQGNRLVGLPFLVPMAVKKTSGIAANLLWDTAEYVLALPDPKKLEQACAKGDEARYRARLLEMRQAFTSRVDALAHTAPADAGLRAAQAFLRTAADECQAALAAHTPFVELAGSGALVSLRLVDDAVLVCQRPAVAAAVAASTSGQEDDEAGDSAPAMCLVTGRKAPVQRLHSAIKGVWGAQTSGANIVSFNLDAFDSHGHAQGANAPVSPEAAFAYTTALNALLARGSTQRMQVADASTVFWAAEPEPLEDELALLLGAGVDNPDAHTQQVRALFDAVRSGAYAGPRGDNRFHVLGLAPNAARIAVRFWQTAPVRELAQRLTTWFDDLALVHAPHEPEFPSLFRLLTAVALQGKADNIPPRLGGELLRSIFSGTPYPASWLQAAVVRCRAEREVTYARAAAIKACLNRAARATACNPRTPDLPDAQEFSPMLDTHHASVAYRLGRLFATLERIQEAASPGLNATIRERYYGAASSTPVAVFTTLLRLKNHHLAKLPYKGQVAGFEKLLGEILGGIADFPAHLHLADQGRFALGYYHQRQDFFTPREARTEDTGATDAPQTTQA